MLLKDYYSIISQSTDEATGAHLFRIKLNGGHEIYKGHFPEKAVSPGVCNLQIMKECAERIVGKELTIKTMAQCKMPAMITPDGTPEPPKPKADIKPQRQSSMIQQLTLPLKAF